MGKHISPHTSRRITLVRRSTSCRGRHPLKEGGNFPLPRLTNSRTPRNLEYNVGDSSRLLVACHEERRDRIHQRVRQVSSGEKSTKQTKTSLVSYLIGHIPHPIHIHSYGLHCQITAIGIIRYNTYHNRHFLKSIHLHTLQRNRKRRTNRQTIRYLRTTPLRTSTPHHLRSRPQIHISFL